MTAVGVFSSNCYGYVESLTVQGDHTHTYLISNNKYDKFNSIIPSSKFSAKFKPNKDELFLKVIFLGIGGSRKTNPRPI